MRVDVVGKEYAMINSKYISFDSDTDRHNHLRFTWVDDLFKREEIMRDKGLLKLAKQDGGHNNFLSAYTVNLEVKASLNWWKQATRYNWFHITGSSSTMHSIMKRELEPSDFDGNVNIKVLPFLNADIREGNFSSVIDNLPMSYIQRRFVATNILQLRTMYNQRKNHKLFDWKLFFDELFEQLPLLKEICKA